MKQQNNYIPAKIHQKQEQKALLEGCIKEIEGYKTQLSNALNFNTFLIRHMNLMDSDLQPHKSEEEKKVEVQIITKSQIPKIEEESDPQEIGEKKIKKKRHLIAKIIKRKKLQKMEEEKQQEKQKEKGQKNDTKNVPKNYGKAILSFIQKNIQKNLAGIKPILTKQKSSFADMMMHIKRHKRKVNSINYLKSMWGYQDQQNPINKCIRILSYIFMRKHCLAYIFNSRVKNYATHIKYRGRIIEGIENPALFTCIKQF